MDIETLFNIRGKTAVVTGGSSGIGFMIAEGLVRAGAEVTIVSRKEQGLKEAADRLRPLGNLHTFMCDLSQERGIAGIAEHVIAQGKLDILINNAGAAWGAPIDEFPRAGFEKVLNINLLAPFMLTKALLPALRAGASDADPARIINIASIDGISIPIWETYPYSASKAGLIHLSRHIAKWLAPENISVNAIAPGFFASRMTDGVLDLDDPASLAAAASPLGHRIGKPEDIVGAVLYLSSRAGAWLTGITIPVAGGQATIN